MRRRVLNKKKIKELETSMPVVLYDNITGEKFQTTKGFYSPNRYIPIGIVVIPSSHNVYGDGSCGIIALKNVDYSSPDYGDNYGSYTYFGGRKDKYTDISSYAEVYKVGIQSGSQANNAIVNNTISGAATSSYLPIDYPDKNYKEYTKAIDGTRYTYNDDNWNNCLPSPYLENNSRNPVYYQIESPASNLNILCDFNGKANTNFYLSKATSQPNWKTDEAIINSYESGYYPAVCCCYRFHTVGTNQGDWYLAASGELGYTVVRKYAINNTIRVLNDYFDIGFPLLTERIFSSSYYNENYNHAVFYNTGLIDKLDKYNPSRFRPFTHLVLPIK